MPSSQTIPYTHIYTHTHMQTRRVVLTVTEHDTAGCCVVFLTVVVDQTVEDGVYKLFGSGSDPRRVCATRVVLAGLFLCVPRVRNPSGAPIHPFRPVPSHRLPTRLVRFLKFFWRLYAARTGIRTYLYRVRSRTYFHNCPKIVATITRGT